MGVRVPSSSIAMLMAFVFSIALSIFCTSLLSSSIVMTDTATERCQGIQPVDQVVVLVIDALRPDFVLPSLRQFAISRGHCEAPLQSSPEAQPYTGPTLSYIEESLRDLSEASHGFFLVADSPTTTAQRLKAISTGTMPTFLEAGSNFNSDAVMIDNIVRQQHGRAIFLGDDTWAKMYPNPSAMATKGDNASTRKHWKSTVPIPSFDVADFHSNDNAVLDSIYDVLDTETVEKTSRDDPYAKLIIGHFLGVDHVGHRLSASNSEMEQKLAQLNVMLRNVSRTLRNRDTSMTTMLLVLGDHGMTNNGDHGGDSAQETDTFLFAQLFRGRTSLSLAERNRVAATTSLSQNMAKRKDEFTRSRWMEMVDDEFHRLVECRRQSDVELTKMSAAFQVDIAPTISVVLGTPIPYSNFGRVIPEVLVIADEDADVESIERCNLRQLERYLNASNMTIPSTPVWKAPGLSLRGVISHISYYCRRTRTTVNVRGLVLGSWVTLTLAMTVVLRGVVRRCFRYGAIVETWTVCVFVLRLSVVVSNSFITKEDTIVFGLLGALLLIPLLTALPRLLGQRRLIELQTKPVPHGNLQAFVTIAMCLIVMRVTVPLAYRHRLHIVHTLEESSVLERAIDGLPPSLQQERIGIFVGCALWLLLEARDGRRRYETVWVLGSGILLSVTNGIPVVHHISPLLLLIVYVVWVGRWLMPRDCKQLFVGTPYPYFLFVLWVSMLCNKKYVASVVSAAYGVALPSLIRSIQHLPVVTQSVILHLLAYVVFFAEGHQCMLNTIDWNASTVGLPSYNFTFGALFVVCRTFNAFIFSIVAVTIVGREGRRYDVIPGSSKTPGAASNPSATKRVLRARGLGNCGTVFSSALLQQLLVHLIMCQAAAACFSVFVQRNHLMLFTIFCPKLIFDAVIFLITWVSCCITGAAMWLTDTLRWTLYR